MVAGSSLMNNNPKPSSPWFSVSGLILASLLLLLALFLYFRGDMRPTKMEQALSKLKPEMKKVEVKPLLADFRLILETNEVNHLDSMTKFYGTNRESTSYIIYAGSTAWLENCVVYFNSNDVVIGHYFHLGD